MSGMDELPGNKKKCRNCGCIYEISEFCEDCGRCSECCECEDSLSWTCDCGSRIFRRYEYASRVYYGEIDGDGIALVEEDGWETDDWSRWECIECGSPPSREIHNRLEDASR